MRKKQYNNNVDFGTIPKVWQIFLINHKPEIVRSRL